MKTQKLENNTEVANLFSVTIPFGKHIIVGFKTGLLWKIAFLSIETHSVITSIKKVYIYTVRE